MHRNWHSFLVGSLRASSMVVGIWCNGITTMQVDSMVMAE